MNDFSKDEVLAILKFEAYKPAKSENKRKMHSEISRRVWLSDREWYSFKNVENMLNANPDTQNMSEFAFIDKTEHDKFGFIIFADSADEAKKIAENSLPLIF